MKIFNKVLGIILFLGFSFINKTYGADVVPNLSTKTQVQFSETSTLTINSGIALGNLSTQNRADINEQSDSSVTVNSGGSILSLNNAVQGHDTLRLTVTNSGTIRAAGSKAINLKDNIGSTITNNRF